MSNHNLTNADIFSEIYALIPDLAEKINQHQLHTPGDPFDTSLHDEFHSFSILLKQAGEQNKSRPLLIMNEEILRQFDQIIGSLSPEIQQIEKLFSLFSSLSQLLSDQIVVHPSSKRRSNDHSVKGQRSKHLIYLLEDNPSEAREMEAQVGYYGYIVDCFRNISELIHEVKQAVPHAIIIDTAFSGQESNLFDLISQLLEKTSEYIPIIFLSETDDINARLQAVKIGGNAFFIKPIDFSSLIDALDRLTTPVTEEPYRVMIVEDTFLQAKLFSLTLNKNGMETRIVTDPLTILDPLKEFNPDLILLDMYMPSCTGMELAKVIRQMEYYVSIPIVYLSAETDIDKQLEAMSEGADDFLAKPIKPNHLITAVTSRVKRYRKLRSLMLYDGLTGLFNHTTTLDRLSQEIGRANRHNEEIIFAMLDLDEFKKVNDTYGHSTGDHVLKSLSLLLKQRLRKTDIMGRLGGEEFGVILPNTSQDSAEVLMNQLRDNFANIHHRFKEHDFFLTFSCGIASSLQCSTTEEIHEAADKALYKAKHQGRNQVVCHQSGDII